MSRKQSVVPSEAQAREKLAMYVFEYLHHLGAQKAAHLFLNEIGWQNPLDIGEAPGFLTSWWSVFWDLYCAAPERREYEFRGDTRAFHEAGYVHNCSHMPSPFPNGFHQGMHGGPMMMMPGGEMLGPGPMEFAGPMGPAMVGNQMMHYGGAMARYNGGNGMRVGSAFCDQGGYGAMTSPQGMALGGPPSVQSVQSNPSALGPQTVSGAGRPSPWRTPNGPSSYCTSPFGAASLPESTGAGTSGALGAMQSDGLGSMLLSESDALFDSKPMLLNGAPSPRADDPLAAAQLAHYAELAGTPRRDATDTAAAILKIKESMREEAKRFETSDSSSVMTPNSN